MELIQDSQDHAPDQAEPNKKKRKFRPQIDKEEKLKRKEKRARIIVRNIPYKSTEETLTEHFKQFGTVNEVNILKKPDGKLVGCAFIQFEKVNQAAKAILKATNKEFLGRPLFVDWAVGKDAYKMRASKTVKQEEIKTEEVEEEPEIKEEENSDDEVKEESISEDDQSENESHEDSEEENGTESDQASDTIKNVKKSIKKEADTKKIPFKSNDVVEGCTIFIKNVPFDATNDDVRKVCRTYGPVYYALVNTDPISGHSKGTAFVKFKTKESADLCLSAGETFQLMDVVLEPHVALSREDIKHRAESSKKEPTDSRNLYLAKEGLIMAGSNAADGVSASDMAKRHKLEQIKTQILKNLNRFVSKNRLSVHNVPHSYDNDKLRNLVEKLTGLKTHECRVMRENKPTAAFPQGKSKGFGFMSFKTHQDALTALRKLNNNPSVFGPQNRPIVAFSIEDRSVHNIKQKRLQKSREHNPTYKTKLEKNLNMRKQKKQNAKDDKNKVQTEIKATASKRKRASSAQNEVELEDFVGVPAEPGSFVRMRSNKKIKEQAREHAKKASAVKKLEKKKKEKIMLMREKREIDRPKQGKQKIEKDNFSNLVDKYKRLIDSASDSVAPKSKRTKWYSE